MSAAEKESSSSDDTMEAKNYYDCPDCDASFENEEELDHHRESKHLSEQTVCASKKFRCEPCDVGFDTQQELDIHNEDHRSPPETEGPTQRCRIVVVCEICSLVLSTNEELARHKEIKHSIFSCPLCGESYSDETTLKRHFLGHGFNCLFCQESSEDQASLFSHIIKHHDDRNFSSGKKCPLCCSPDKFFYLYGFVAHCQANHPDVYPFSCNFCKRVFKKNTDLIEHLVTHSPDVKKRKRSEETTIFKRPSNVFTRCTTSTPRSSPSVSGRPRSSSTTVSVSSTETHPVAPVARLPGTSSLPSSPVLQPSPQAESEEKKTYLCLDCRRIFPHGVKHTCLKNPEINKCIFCYEIFPTEGALKDHYVHYHNYCPQHNIIFPPGKISRHFIEEH